MNVLLLNPNRGRFKIAHNVHITFRAFIPPLGLLYIAKMAELAGHHVKIIDFNAEQDPINTLHRSLSNMDVVGMTLLSGPEYAISQQIAQEIKKLKPDIPLILGGPHCSLYPKQTLEDYQADVSIQGEAEYRIVPLLNALQGKQSLSSIPGLVYRTAGGIFSTSTYEQIKNLDALPFPSRHLVRHYNYGYSFGVKVIPGVVTSMITSRGCTFHCTFCQQTAFHPTYQSLSAQKITQEIDEIVHNGYTSIVFADDNFLANKKQTVTVMNHIIKEEYDLRLWILNARVDSADRELFMKLRDAGVENIMFGIESGSQEILDFYNKRITLAQIRKAVNLSHEMGFFTTGNFIIGSPIENEHHIRQTIAFARSLPLDNAIFKDLAYMAKSSLWQEAVDHGKINPNEAMVLGNPDRGLGLFTERELQRNCDKACFAFVTNPKYWLRELHYSLSHHKPQFLRLGMKMFLRLHNP